MFTVFIIFDSGDKFLGVFNDIEAYLVVLQGLGITVGSWQNDTLILHNPFDNKVGSIVKRELKLR